MRIGEFERLKVIGESEHGLYLGDGETKVLLPQGQCPDDLLMNDYIEVFLYTDSEDRPVATLKKPVAKVGDFALLRCISVTNAGAFLDWGLDKDLFCPVKEQNYHMMAGEEYLVRIYLDVVSNRVACSSKLNRFLKADGDLLEPGEKVQIMVADFHPDWITVIINGAIKGSIFPDEWHEKLKMGEVRDAYVKRIRPEDRRVAISLRPQGYQAILGERDRILQAIRDNGGTLPVSDRSTPEEIHRRFGLSKGAFKKLIGSLFRDGLIDIGAKEIRLK